MSSANAQKCTFLLPSGPQPACPCAAPCVSVFDSARSLLLRVPARKSSRRRRDPTHSLALRVPARDLALLVPARSLCAACLFCPPTSSRLLAQAWVWVLSAQ